MFFWKISQYEQNNGWEGFPYLDEHEEGASENEIDNSANNSEPENGWNVQGVNQDQE